jgi:hypothetical protein
VNTTLNNNYVTKNLQSTHSVVHITVIFNPKIIKHTEELNFECDPINKFNQFHQLHQLHNLHKLFKLINFFLSNDLAHFYQ